ncbi:MAG: class I SAM-dependent methyltransferase [Balneolaceae bacterium]
MSKIAYDPIKDSFAGFIRRSRVLRRIFYFILDLIFLRGWHVRRQLKKAGGKLDATREWKLLDAGCGFGQYDRFILDRFRKVRVASMDVKESYLEDCRFYFQDEIGKNRIQFFYGDLLDAGSLEQEAFDFIICIDVLEHIEQDRAALRNMARSLKPGGYFLMHSPSHYSSEDAGEEDSFVGEHARAGYSKQEITAKMQEAGLAPERVRYTYGRYGHFAWRLSVKVPLIWFNKIGMSAGLPLLVYYPLVIPLCLILNFLDLHVDNKKGNGVCAFGIRPPVGDG